MTGLNFLIAAGALHGLLLSCALLLLAVRRKNAALRWLAGFIGAFSLVVTGDVLVQTGAIIAVPHLYQLFDALIFCLGPLCFGYVRALLGLPGWRKSVLLAHFVPCVALYMLVLPGILQDTAAKRLMILADLAITPAPGLDVLGLFAGLQVLTYLLCAIALMQRYWRELESVYSNIERFKLSWLAQLLTFCALVWAVWMVSIVFQASWSEWASQLALGVGIYALGYCGLHQPQLWAGGNVLVASPVAETTRAVTNASAEPGRPAFNLSDERHGNASQARSDHAMKSTEPERLAQAQALPSRPKYAKTGVSELDMARVGELLGTVMTTELLYLEPELSLAELAARLNVSAHTLSQTLNVHFRQSFFEYINGLRVREVRRCFADPAFATQSILEIALASGFASKATFNATFKRLTGQTPSAARFALLDTNGGG